MNLDKNSSVNLAYKLFTKSRMEFNIQAKILSIDA